MNLKSRSKHAVTLVEMLVVMTIMGILLALALPALNKTVQPNQLTAATQMISDQLNLARQEALSRNRLIEVRFYKLTSAEFPQPAFTGIRMMILDEYASTATALGKIEKLPQGVLFMDDNTHSCWSDLPGPLQETVPGMGSVDYHYLRFRPDGSSDLDASSNNSWFWTLRNKNDTAAPGTLPANFSTIQLDPVTGRIRIFRP